MGHWRGTKGQDRDGCAEEQRATTEQEFEVIHNVCVEPGRPVAAEA
jgi:hypothetical protein